MIETPYLLLKRERVSAIATCVPKRETALKDNVLPMEQYSNTDPEPPSRLWPEFLISCVHMLNELPNRINDRNDMLEFVKSQLSTECDPLNLESNRKESAEPI